MTSEEAAMILHSETSRDYIRENNISFQEVEEACDIGADLLKQVVFCKDCKKHGKSKGLASDICPLIEFRGKPQGHEFDYQFCVYGERK